MPRSKAVPWSREHFLVALNLYCKIPFPKLHRGNPLIIDIAARLGRTASSLAMKLCNFAALDPVLRARGISGLGGVTRRDREYWDEFHTNVESLGTESEQLLHDLYTHDESRELDFLNQSKVRLERSDSIRLPSGVTEASATVKVRRGQQFFRQCVLNAYTLQCCISGINVPELLVASHIKPWRDCTHERLDPRNGLCLSSIHDAAFDCGLITIDEQLRVILGKRLKSYYPQSSLEQSFTPFEGKPIRLPQMLAEPSQIFLEYHRSKVFVG